MRKFIDLFENQNFEQILTEAPTPGTRRSRATPEEFIEMVRKAYPGNVNIPLTGLIKVADDNNVQIPTAVKFNNEYKPDPHHWNFGNGSDDSSFNQAKPELEKGLDGQVADTAVQAGPEYDTAVKLSHAKAKEFHNLVQKGKVYVMGRKPNGAFFRVPGMDGVAAQLERMMSNQLDVNAEDSSMETQYEDLTEKVQLILGGQSSFIKSLLITGAPRSGKTFNVMKTVKELGLVDGVDYTKKTGSITVTSLYRTLLQRINGLVIFDDCDSVARDDDGINILKGALDTSPVREISYDNQRMVDVDGFSVAKREEYANRVSRLLNDGEYTREDDAFFRPIAEKYGVKTGPKKKRGRPKVNRDEDDDFGDASLDDEVEIPEDEDGEIEGQTEILAFVTKRLPNKFDFKGRVIFISNLDQDDWDPAILARSFRIQMNFKGGEMLDYIDKIKANIKCSLTDEEKQETMDYVRELYNLGKIRAPINFGLIQSAFDMRLTPSWKRTIANF